MNPDNTHNPDVERAVLGVLIEGHAAAYPTYIDVCRGPMVFWTRDHRIVALAIAQVVESGGTLSSVSVFTRLTQMPFRETWEALKAIESGWTIKPSDIPDLSDSAFAAIGGAMGFHAVTSAFAPVSGFAENCRHLADYHRLRQMGSILADAVDRTKAADGPAKTADIADRVITSLAALVKIQEGTMTISGAMRKAMQRHAVGNTTPDARVASWGVPGLDRALPLRPCRYVVLAAQPGHGKSSLALQAAVATASELGNAAVAMVNFEMPAEQIGTILLARGIQATAKTIESGRLSVEQSADAEAEIVRRENADIYLRTTSRKMTINEIVGWIRQRHMRSAGRLALVVIDYLQLIGRNGRQTEYDCITEASQALKGLANELRICLLVLSQLNREGSKSDRDSHGRSKGNPEPRMQDLRGSGSIEQDADAIVFIWPPAEVDEADLPVNLKIAKNRGGAKPRIEAVFERARGQTFRMTSAPASLDPDGSSRSHHNHPPRDDEDALAT